MSINIRSLQGICPARKILRFPPTAVARGAAVRFDAHLVGRTRREGAEDNHGDRAHVGQGTLRGLLLSPEPAVRDLGWRPVRDLPAGAARGPAPPQPDALRVP